ncbi:MAG: electron transport complex subunit RsxE, partial [Burkholderiales bacterium]|nr:electron transport complex subunit RsxE [Burkholderiales bacterium]
MATDARAGRTAGGEEFRKGVWHQNPVLVQALGLCPVLAVSNTARNALAMGLA